MNQNTITRVDICQAIMRNLNVTKSYARTLLRSLLEIACTALENDQELKLLNFGTFSVYQKDPRIGRNPKTKVPAIITSRKVVGFSPSAALKEKVKHPS